MIRMHHLTHDAAHLSLLPSHHSAWNMMDETWIINDVKEKLCYVSTDFERELQAARSVHIRRVRRDAVETMRTSGGLTRLLAHLILRLWLLPPIQEITQSCREDSKRVRPSERIDRAARICASQYAATIVGFSCFGLEAAAE